MGGSPGHPPGRARLAPGSLRSLGLAGGESGDGFRPFPTRLNAFPAREDLEAWEEVWELIVFHEKGWSARPIAQFLLVDCEGFVEEDSAGSECFGDGIGEGTKEEAKHEHCSATRRLHGDSMTRFEIGTDPRNGQARVGGTVPERTQVVWTPVDAHDPSAPGRCGAGIASASAREIEDRPPGGRLDQAGALRGEVQRSVQARAAMRSTRSAG